MSVEIPTNNPEKKEILDKDNARKFVLEGIDPAFLEQRDVKAFTLTSDWLVKTKDLEKKLAYKVFKNGEIQILFIEKIRKDGDTSTPPRRELRPDEYEKLRESSVLKIVKDRYEFKYDQSGTEFALKYDAFAGSKLRILEVDAESEEKRESFDPTEFPYKIEEVTGQEEYYGYRVAEVM